MLNKNLPQVNDRMFYVNKEIIVLKIFRTFQLAQIRYLYSPVKFVVDINTLSRYPNETSSISIKILGGEKR